RAVGGEGSGGARGCAVGGTGGGARGGRPAVGNVGLAEGEHEAVGPGEERHRGDEVDELERLEAERPQPVDLRRRRPGGRGGEGGGEVDDGGPALVLPGAERGQVTRRPAGAARDVRREEAVDVL